jgi:replication initiation and membrane attachment protein DnaB
LKFYTKANSIYFKSVSSQDYLKVLKGHVVSNREKESVLGLLFKYDLPEEVVNTILHYLIVFKQKPLTDKKLEEIAIMLVGEKIKSSEEAILYLEKNENKMRLNSVKTEEAMIKGANELALVNEQLDQAIVSFKERCSIDQKKVLISTMNNIIRISCNQSVKL